MKAAQSLLLLLSFANSFCAGEEVIATTSFGALRGRRISTARGNNASVFLGIPYAAAPVGQLRFAPTQAFAAKWSGVRDAGAYADDCWITKEPSSVAAANHSEDCLYTNIIAGSGCSASSPCPVIVYVFGGKDAYGTPREYPLDVVTDNLAAQGLVVAIPNLRLGAFGLWSGPDATATRGNYLYHDLLEHFRWVQGEAAAFGGDATRVTAMGDSSGAQQLSRLSLSPKAEGLFARLVLLSGSGANLRQVSDKDKDVALSSAVGCGDALAWAQAPGVVLDCMRSRPPQDILNAHKAMQTLSDFPARVDGPGGVFPEHLTSLAAKRRPLGLFIGTTKWEYGGVFQEETEALGLSTAQLESRIAQQCARMAANNNATNVNITAVSCRSVYDGTDMPLSRVYGQLASDELFLLPSYIDALSMVASGAPVYLYRFDYHRKGEDPQKRPHHADDLSFLMWHRLTKEAPYDAGDLQMEVIYSTLIGNFAKSGDPSPDWTPLDPQRANFFSLSLQPANTDGYLGRWLPDILTTPLFLRANLSKGGQTISLLTSAAVICALVSSLVVVAVARTYRRRRQGYEPLAE